MPEWATLAAVVVSGLLLIVTAGGSGTRLTRSQDPEFFAVWLFVLRGLASMVAGVGATLRRGR